MPKKRRNNGHRIRGKTRGHINRVRCVNCSASVAKDKAIKKNIVNNIVSSAISKDILDASVYKNYNLPKTYKIVYYCISCAVHKKLVFK